MERYEIIFVETFIPSSDFFFFYVESLVLCFTYKPNCTKAKVYELITNKKKCLSTFLFIKDHRCHNGKYAKMFSGYIIFTDRLVSYLLQYSILMYTQLEPN